MGELDQLRQAILDRRPEDVWKLARAHPELVTKASDSGLTVLDVALATGELSSVLAVVTHGATSEDWAPSSKLLPDYMAYLSGGFAAGWLEGIEFETYSLAIGGQIGDDWEYPVSERQIDDLRMLSSEFGGWATWSNEGGRFVSMAEWRGLFEEWVQHGR